MSLADPVAAASAYPVTSPDSSPNPIDTESAQGHGAISVGYTSSLGNGLRISDGNISHVGSTRIRSLNLTVYYNLTDDWSMHLGLPFVSNRSVGPPTHCPTTAPPCQNRPALSPQHPESQYVDDGVYHGAWQDWAAGVSYHKDLAGYIISPSLSVSIPSHDYVFFGNAAAGQRLWKIEPAIELAHQFDFTNIYYRVRYGYVFAQQKLGQSVNHHRLDLELGYFVNPKWTLRAFTLGKVGDGQKAGTIFQDTQGFTNEFWYRHDQTGAHNYASAGIGTDYQLGDRYTLSASFQKMLWGQTVFNFLHTFDVRLTRSF